MRKYIAGLLILFLLLAGCKDSGINAQSEKIDRSELAQISVGMTLGEVREILGSEGKDVGSGLLILEYSLTDDTTVYLTFMTTGDGSNPNDHFVLERIVYDELTPED